VIAFLTAIAHNRNVNTRYLKGSRSFTHHNKYYIIAASAIVSEMTNIKLYVIKRQAKDRDYVVWNEEDVERKWLFAL